MFSNSKIVYLSNQCLEWFINTYGRCNSSYYSETDRRLKVRSGEHIGISPLTFRKFKPSKESAICDHLLIFNNIPSFDKFNILAYDHEKYILEMKESLLIKRNRPVLNKNISSAKLFIFGNSQNFERFYYTVILFFLMLFDVFVTVTVIHT